MTSFQSKSAYAPHHRHSFFFEERKNGSVVIGPCDTCGMFPARELNNQGWVIVLDSEQDETDEAVPA